MRPTSTEMYPYVKGKCRVCGTVLTGRQRTFCSPECVEKLLDDTDWGRIRKRVFERDNGICQICRIEVDGKALNGYHVDHIKPISKGGLQLDMNNLQLSCPVCNLKKSDKFEGE